MPATSSFRATVLLQARLLVRCLTTLICLGALFLLNGCASGRQQAVQLAEAGGFSPVRFETQPYLLLGWLRPGQGRILYVYIEGDGLAWRRVNRPSSDPTPTNPVAFRLAEADPTTGPVLYLARPCQYTEGEDRRGCSVADWTYARFSARAVGALNEAINQAKARVRADSVALHGYSGGGAMAALLAARRNDVVFLATVAGNLDHKLWTTYHDDSPLSESLNPVDTAAATRDTPQMHVVGGKDAVVPPAILDAWLRRIPGARAVRVVVPGVSHEGPWEKLWPELLRQARTL